MNNKAKIDKRPHSADKQPSLMAILQAFQVYIYALARMVVWPHSGHYGIVLEFRYIKSVLPVAKIASRQIIKFFARI